MTEFSRQSDLERLRRISKPTPEQQLALCRAEAGAGNRVAAFEAAVSLASTCESPAIAAAALAVAARIDFIFARLVDGQNRFRRAKSLAVEARDKVLVAQVTAIYVESLLHFVGFDAAASQFTELRLAAIRSGSSEAMFWLHLLMAEGELKTGRSHRAIREIELARACLNATEPNIVLQANLEITHSNLLGTLDDVRGAERHAAMAVTLARQCGLVNVLQPALNNLGHHQMARGNLAAAEQALLPVLGPRTASVDIDLSRRSTHLQLALAQNDLDLAATIDSEFGPIAELRESIHAVWYELARCAYLLRAGAAEKVLQIANRCLAVLERLGDRTLVDQARLALAEAYAALGHKEDAAAQVTPVALGSMARVLMSFASTERVLAKISAPSERAADHYARAARVFGYAGNAVARGISLHDLATFESADQGKSVGSIESFYGDPESIIGQLTTSSTQSSEAAVAASIDTSAALIDLMSRPSLAGHELLHLVAASGACRAAVLTAEENDKRVGIAWIGSSRLPSDVFEDRQTVRLDLGSDGGRRYSIFLLPAESGSALVTILSLQRIVAAARLLHDAIHRESEKSAIRPEQLPEQQLGFVCASETMLDLLKTTRRVGASPIAVLIIGETGTGKELLGRAVHQCSPRHRAIFLPFNCTGVPKDMLDGQLFGHRRGAFTGAHESAKGVIRSAEGGTLFLDEIGEIGLDLQPKLLRFLESNEVHPIGEPTPVTVDVRVVAATNANLDQMVSDGRFREDLFYRLNVVRLTIPPLRERREEIPLLIDHFMERAQKELNKTGLQLAESTQEFLLLYSWPGNVRELSNEIRRLVALAESDAVLMPEHLSPKIAASRRTVAVTQKPPEPNELLVRRDQPLSAAVEHVERTLIQDALRATGSMDLAAKMLGLSRKGLYLKRQRLKIDE